ncbi:MAG: RNA polymerase sigma factor [Oscillospiraceae bacterium]|nr:RNA polymerase sigma factor [Oscillospiraceae bacterium]
MKAFKAVEAADGISFAQIYEETMPSLYRLCYAFVKNRADTQDLVQSTYIKLLQSGKVFENGEHRKAWLIVTARNLCKSHLRHWWRRAEPLEAVDGALFDPPPEHSGVTEAVLNLPDKYKMLIFLYYYEGYDTKEISNILQKNSSTVRRQLAEARAILGGVLDEEI